ncbi:MAG: PepSY-like domain-containing protein [Psychroflexus sp.]|nr:PepSY-like domain-containing protein [Psychroflexus sp.]MDN6310316.1 PepSY-like domain-containing protein [Psychroflexus sp.]
MKKLVFTALFAAATVGVSQANTLVDPIDSTVASTLQNEKEIDFSEVPQAVKDAFEQDGHAEGDILKITETDSGEGLTEYKFLLEKEGKKTEISYKAQAK